MATAELQPQQKCPVCNAASNAGKKYCADCGAPLTSTDYRQVIHAEVTGFLADHLKDRHVVEIELCESVVGRLEKWTKWFGWGVALPVALILGGLTFFGFEKVHDINILAAKVDNEVKPKVEGAMRDADEASKNANQAKLTSEQVVIDVNNQLMSARGVTAKVEELSVKVAALESQTTTKVTSATKRIEQQVNEVDQRVSDAQARISETEQKLTDTGELVKSLFASSRVEEFDETMVGHYIVREGNNRRVIYMLLKEIPIPQSVQLQFYISTEPRNSYFTINNVVIFFWGDPPEVLKQHPLLVSYTADPNAKEKPFHTLEIRKDLIFADSVQLPNAK
jgi:hypothetical protein